MMHIKICRNETVKPLPPARFLSEQGSRRRSGLVVFLVYILRPGRGTVSYEEQTVTDVTSVEVQTVVQAGCSVSRVEFFVSRTSRHYHGVMIRARIWCEAIWHSYFLTDIPRSTSKLASLEMYFHAKSDCFGCTGAMSTIYRCLPGSCVECQEGQRGWKA